MRWLAVPAIILGFAAGIFADRTVIHPNTHIVAVCDNRGNTVYTSSDGGLFALKGC